MRRFPTPRRGLQVKSVVDYRCQHGARGRHNQAGGEARERPGLRGRINEREWRSSSARPTPRPGLQVKPVVDHRCQAGAPGNQHGPRTSTTLPERCQPTSTSLGISPVFPISPGLPASPALHGICVNRAAPHSAPTRDRVRIHAHAAF